MDHDLLTPDKRNITVTRKRKEVGGWSRLDSRAGMRGKNMRKLKMCSPC